MSLQITTQPNAEPVTLAEVKARLRLTTSADDALITSYITTARTFAERVARVSLVSKGYTLTRSGFPWPNEPIRLPVPPVSAVTSVEYMDGTYAWVTWDPAEYIVGLSQFPAIIKPKTNFTYPTPVGVDGLDTVRIVFTAGPGGSALKLDFTQNLEGIRQLAAHLYEHPSAVTIETLKEMPLGIQALLSNNKLQVFP